MLYVYASYTQITIKLQAVTTPQLVCYYCFFYTVGATEYSLNQFMCE